MPLHLTKIAFGCQGTEDLAERLERQGALPEQNGEARLTTRYVPKRLAELTGGSLYWIHEHTLIGRSPLLGFDQRAEDGRWWIRLEPRLILVDPRRKRAHQMWRYLEDADAPRDLVEGATCDTLPARLVGELARLGLV